MQVTILRHDPIQEKGPYQQNFSVPYHPGATVLNVLESIWETQDSTLAFRASCRMQKCGGCAVNVNGKPVLSCKERVNGNKILIEPLPNYPIVKDLVVDRSQYEERIGETLSLVSPSSELMPPRPIDNPSWPDCIECLICDATCPIVTESSDVFWGPAHLMGIPGLSPQSSKSQLERLANQSYLCLACQNCDTNCPTGVTIGSLIEWGRGEIESVRKRPLWERALRRVVLHGIFRHPQYLNTVVRLLRVYQRTVQRILHRSGADKYLPEPLRTMEAILPPIPSQFFTATPMRHYVDGGSRGQVAFFPGCFMNTIYSSASKATVYVLSKNGYEVLVPSSEVCCGAPHAALGELDIAKTLAKNNVDTLSQIEVEAIITNCAACGTMLKEYSKLLEDDQDYSEKAASVSRKVRDFSEFLASELIAPMGELKRTVTYHDPCHLVHTQGIADQPRQLLRSIPGLDLIELNESGQCCGSAGIYNLIHCEIAERVLARKVRNISDTGATTVVTLNPGCHMQISYGLRKHGFPIEVVHLAEILAHAYEAQER